MNIKRELHVAKVARKINSDLDKIAKAFGESEHVTGTINISYENVPIDIFDEALCRVTKYERHRHNVLIKSKLQVNILLN